jgi:hypothetical protein
MARVLNLGDSRIAEIFAGKRSVKLEEAAKLVAAFGLEETPAISSQDALAPLIKHIAEVLGRPLSDADERLERLKADVKAFAEFQSDLDMRSSPAAIDGFFRGLRARSSM